MLMENFGPEAQIEILSLSVPVLSTQQSAQPSQKCPWPRCSWVSGSAGQDEHSQHDVVASHTPHTVTSSQAAMCWLNLG